MPESTYSIPLDDGICVVTESNKGKRGWAFTYVASDPESDYGVYESAASIKWNGDDPKEDGADAGVWNTPIYPTEAVEDYLKQTYTLALHSSRRSGVTAHGLRRGYNEREILLRALKDAKGLI